MKQNRNILLTQARKKLGLNIQEFLDEIGIVHTVYNSIETLKYYPSEQTQSKISEYLALKGIDYLEGELFPRKIYGKINRLEFISLDEIDENTLQANENLAEKNLTRNN